MIKSKIKKAFTLVEMLIVVVIIGILAAALIPKLTGAEAKARDAARKANLNQINTALRQFFNDYWAYPGTGNTTLSIDNVSWDIAPKYITSLPTDPQAQRTVAAIYNWSAVGSWTSGQFGYTPMRRNWATAAWFVLLANTESQWQSSNWVFDSSVTSLSAWWNWQSSLQAGAIDGLNTEASELERTTCKMVNLAAADSLQNCTAKIAQNLYYVLIQ